MALIEGPEFTFTPGATKTANTYGVWADLMAKINTQPVRRPIITITSDFTLPAGTWDLQGGILQSPLPLGGVVTLTVPDGAYIDNCWMIRTGLKVDCTHTIAGDTILFSSTPMGQPKLLRVDLGGSLYNTGTQPLITIGINELGILALTQSGDLLATTSIFRGSDVTSTIYGLDRGAACTFPDNWVDGIGNLAYAMGVYQNQPDIPNWLGVPPARSYSALSQNVIYNPNTLPDWSSPPPAFVNTALNELASREQTHILAALSNPATFFSGEYAGPYYNDTSDLNIVAFGSGSGFFRVPTKGTFRNFQFNNSQFPGSPIQVDLYLAPGGNPFLFAYTGVSITMPPGDYISSNVIDTLDVLPDDLIVAYNASPFGYTPSNLTITAQFIPKL